MDAETSAEANTALDNLRTANADLTAEHTGMDGAGMAYMRARDAAAMAEMYANTHVLGLFMQANAYDIDTPIQDDFSSEDMNEAMTVAEQRTTEVASIGAGYRYGGGCR